VWATRRMKKMKRKMKRELGVMRPTQKEQDRKQIPIPNWSLNQKR
jgi:hypothetical protein